MKTVLVLFFPAFVFLFCCGCNPLKPDPEIQKVIESIATNYGGTFYFGAGVSTSSNGNSKYVELTWEDADAGQLVGDRSEQMAVNGVAYHFFKPLQEKLKEVGSITIEAEWKKGTKEYSFDLKNLVAVDSLIRKADTLCMKYRAGEFNTMYDMLPQSASRDSLWPAVLKQVNDEHEKFGVATNDAILLGFYTYHDTDAGNKPFLAVVYRIFREKKDNIFRILFDLSGDNKKLIGFESLSF